MQIISKIGIILFFAGLALMLHAQCNLEIIPASEVAFSSDGSRIYDAGLICEKLNLTIVAGVLLICGLLMALAGQNNDYQT